MICSGPVWGLVAKITNTKDGLWRVTFPEDQSLPLEGMEERIRTINDPRILSTDDPYELVSFAPHRVPERTCPTYNMGRIVRAGDKAQNCNPCRGRALTGGIMDVDRFVDTF